jgi:hypothetical protein
MLFEARELIDMFNDIVENRSGKVDDWSRRVRDEIDAFRAVQGWSAGGFGGEGEPGQGEQQGQEQNLWFLALCVECNEGVQPALPIPFPDRETRTSWVNEHMAFNGHKVGLIDQPRRSDDKDERDEKSNEETTP